MAGDRYEHLSRDVTHKLSSVLDRLRHVWDEIGLDAEQRRTRTEVVVVHVNNLLEEMVKEEEGLRDRLLKNIQKYGAGVLRLSKELGITPYEPPEGQTNVQLEKDLRRKVSALEQERHDRMDQLAKLQKDDQHLCDILCATPIYIASSAVPTLRQLEELKTQIASLTTEKEKRHNIFTTTKEKILKMLDQLEQCPNTSFERELICEDDSFLLTGENMTNIKLYYEGLERQQKENFALASQLRDHMETLWERLHTDQDERSDFRTKNTGFKPKIIEKIKAEISRLELLKLEKIQQVIENTRKELTEWWDKCYMDQGSRDQFTLYMSDQYTEDVLIQHEDEVQQMKIYYENNRDMLDLVERWQTLFEQYLEHQRKASDPNRFFNRGCNLLKEEKARKKVEKDLPKVEEDVTHKIHAYEKKTGRKFLVSGVQFTQFIEQQWVTFKSQKEVEKNQRQQAKAKLMEEELKYGSRPATTPGKKRPLGNGTTPGKTPSKTPTKRFRADNGQVTIAPSYNSTTMSAQSEPRSKGRLALTAHKHTPTANTTSRSGARKILTDKTYPSSNVTGFSHTTVSCPSTTTTDTHKGEASDQSLCSVGPYQDFAKGLNQNSRPNCRSSVLPSQLKPAYF